jgi:hypothetical protein
MIRSLFFDNVAILTVSHSFDLIFCVNICYNALRSLIDFAASIESWSWIFSHKYTLF